MRFQWTPLSVKFALSATPRGKESRAGPAQWAWLVLVSFLAWFDPALAEVADPVVVRGPLRLLVVAVHFPGTEPALSFSQVKEKVAKVNGEIRTASYGKTWLVPKVMGWYEMPGPSKYVDQSCLNEALRKLGAR